MIAGVWGNGDARKKNLEAAGYSYDEIQKMVNVILNVPKKSETTKVVATCGASKFDKSFGGTYRTTSDLYCRNDAGTNKKALCLIPKGTKVQCYGYYSLSNRVKWLYIQFTLKGVQYTGFSSIEYLRK